MKISVFRKLIFKTIWKLNYCCCPFNISNFKYASGSGKILHCRILLQAIILLQLSAKYVNRIILFCWRFLVDDYFVDVYFILLTILGLTIILLIIILFCWRLLVDNYFILLTILGWRLFNFVDDSFVQLQLKSFCKLCLNICFILLTFAFVVAVHRPPADHWWVAKGLPLISN